MRSFRSKIVLAVLTGTFVACEARAAASQDNPAGNDLGMICPDVPAHNLAIGVDQLGRRAVRPPAALPAQGPTTPSAVRSLSLPAFQYLHTVQPRIFYGHKAGADKVGTGFVETNVGGVSELCSGVLIGAGKVLTAAHCVADSATKMRVGFGPIEGPAATVPVLTATPKPAYKLSQSGNDLAVLGIDPAKLCAVYKPYAVAKADNLMLLAPAEMTVVGYGLTERQVHGSRLEASIPVASLTCFQQWATGLGCKTFEELILSSVIMPASGVVKGTDTCNGDSGGPAFVYPGNKIGVGSPMLAAITSQGISLGGVAACGSGGIYEVVGTIENINWLKQIVPDLNVE